MLDGEEIDEITEKERRALFILTILSTGTDVLLRGWPDTSRAFFDLAIEIRQTPIEVFYSQVKEGNARHRQAYEARFRTLIEEWEKDIDKYLQTLGPSHPARDAKVLDFPPRA
jgi:hypothetical protein